MSDQKISRPRRRVEETSAGGFVLAADGSFRVALIGRQARNGRIDWCVPKGHPEGVETLEQAAMREVWEETGISAEIIEAIGSIQYEFAAGPKLIAKTVHHYILRQTGGELTVDGDPDREAVDVRWVELDLLTETLAHENERRMARNVIEWVERTR
ncbi:MAG: hypothetical protein RL508_226 [Actinomycetota bacterium]|jgi:8-oxo-dGTP pyrophosphatase MutT (NUDIX family)